MSVHDAWPCFLWDCGEEMHCGSSMWRGGCSPCGSQQAKKRKGSESAYLQQGMPARDSPSSNQDSPLSVPSAPNSAPDQFFSKWASGANSPKPQSLWIYPWGHQTALMYLHLRKSGSNSQGSLPLQTSLQKIRQNFIHGPKPCWACSLFFVAYFRAEFLKPVAWPALHSNCTYVWTWLHVRRKNPCDSVESQCLSLEPDSISRCIKHGAEYWVPMLQPLQWGSGMIPVQTQQMRGFQHGGHV